MNNLSDNSFFKDYSPFAMIDLRNVLIYRLNVGFWHYSALFFNGKKYQPSPDWAVFKFEFFGPSAIRTL